MPRGANQQLPRGQKPCQITNEVGPETFLKQIFFYRDVFKFFFLQGRKSKYTHITGTVCIFKPKKKVIIANTLYSFHWKFNISTAPLHNKRTIFQRLCMYTFFPITLIANIFNVIIFYLTPTPLLTNHHNNSQS